MKKHTQLLGIIFLFLLAAMACNQLQEDSLVEPEIPSTLNATIQADLPIVLDLIERHNPSNSATFRITRQGQMGEAKFIQAGLLLYKPNEEVMSNGQTDRIAYDLCQQGDCQQFEVAIQYSPNAEQNGGCFVSKRYAIFDTIPICIGIAGLLDSTALDSTSSQWDLSSFEIVEEPTLGTAEVHDGEIITYYPFANICDSITDGEERFSDIVVYSMEDRITSERCFGVLEFVRVCSSELPPIHFPDSLFSINPDTIVISLSALADSSTTDSTSYAFVIDVLSNDVFDRTLPFELTIADLASNGWVNVSPGGRTITYEMDPQRLASAGTIDEFEYELCSGGSFCGQAPVYILFQP